MINDGSAELDERQPMERGDFAIGREFETATGTWRCTDVGSRTIVAIKVSDHPDDPSWLNGPPYAVVETIFDEYDLGGCWPVGSAEGRDAEEDGAAAERPEATRSELLAAVREAASDLHDAGVMGTGALRRLYAMTDEAPDAEGTSRLLYVDSLAEPAARLRLTVEGVQLTLLTERRTGFLAWLASDAAGHVYRLMSEHEREADVDEAFAEQVAALPDEGAASGPGLEPTGATGGQAAPSGEGR